MPTILGHAAIATAAAFGIKSRSGLLKLLILGIVCSIFPDVDILGYQWLYIPYKSFCGHRGFFHSFFFAALFSALVVYVFYRKEANISKTWWTYFVYFFMITASHGVLDALTNGGHGVALLSPFSNQRYFLPWTPIEVSPLSLRAFLGQRGLTVLKTELLWIWVPSVAAVLFIKIIGHLKLKERF